MRSRGRPRHVNDDGSNVWRQSPDRQLSYLKKNMAPEQIAAVIEQLMLHTPPAARDPK